MPHVYASVDDLEATPKVGSHQCVALVRHYASLPETAKWRAGVAVLGDLTIKKGTAIATFVDGKYPNSKSGNHAGFYLSQSGEGLWIMDQWVDDSSKPKVCKRFMRKKGAKDGKFVDPSNNADAFSVIETS